MVCYFFYFSFLERNKHIFGFDKNKISIYANQILITSEFLNALGVIK